MDEKSELVAMLTAVGGIIVAIGGLFKVLPPIIDACKGIGCDCNFGIIKCRCCTGLCNPIVNTTTSGDTAEVEDEQDLLENSQYIINSLHNGCNLQCRPDGSVSFANKNEGQWEKWAIERKDDKWFFVSVSTGYVLQCDGSGRLRCANQNREWWEAFTLDIVEEGSRGDAGSRKVAAGGVPTGVKLVLKAHTGNNIQCVRESGIFRSAGHAQCENTNKGGWEMLKLKKIESGNP